MNRAANDLISRAAAIDAMYYKPNHKMAIEVLKEMPAVDAAPVVHGRWIDIPDKREWDQKMCSICGDYRCCQSNYCPNCGAKMESEHNMSKSNKTTIGHWLDGNDDLPPIGGFHD